MLCANTLSDDLPPQQEGPDRSSVNPVSPLTSRGPDYTRKLLSTHVPASIADGRTRACDGEHVHCGVHLQQTVIGESAVLSATTLWQKMLLGDWIRIVRQQMVIARLPARRAFHAGSTEETAGRLDFLILALPLTGGTCESSALTAPQRHHDYTHVRINRMPEFQNPCADRYPSKRPVVPVG
jgi:hypothetical protein